jgi:hypothetical protein
MALISSYFKRSGVAPFSLEFFSRLKDSISTPSHSYFLLLQHQVTESVFLST